MRSIQGQVMIHGFVVKPGGVFHPFYSPDCSSLLAVSTIMDASPNITDASQNVMNASPDVTVASPDTDVIRRSLSNEDSDTVRHVLTAVDSRCVVLIFKRLECRVCSYVASVKPFTQLFSGVTQSDGSVVTPVGTLDLAVVDRLPDTCMNYDDDYRRAVGRFCDDVKEGEYCLIYEVHFVLHHLYPGLVQGIFAECEYVPWNMHRIIIEAILQFLVLHPKKSGKSG